jgi:hypothetical protein
LGLSEDEVAFYDALEVNDSAVKVLAMVFSVGSPPWFGGYRSPEHNH